MLVEFLRTEYTLSDQEPLDWHDLKYRIPLFSIHLGQILRIENYQYQEIETEPGEKCLEDFEDGVRLHFVVYKQEPGAIRFLSSDINKLRINNQKLLKLLNTIMDAHTDADLIYFDRGARDLANRISILYNIPLMSTSKGVATNYEPTRKTLQHYAAEYTR